MAGGKGAIFQNDILNLIFNGVGIPNIADNAASGPLTQLYVSLHTFDPGAGGYQNTSEATYPGYARVAVARTSAGWTVNGSTVSPAATISFPQCTAVMTETENYAAVGTAATGSGKILYRGPLSPGISVSNGITPQLDQTTALTES